VAEQAAGEGWQAWIEPPPVHVPLPVLPSSVNWLALSAVTVNTPLAAELPVTLEMTTRSPVTRPWLVAVMVIGEVLVAASQASMWPRRAGWEAWRARLGSPARQRTA